MLEYSIIQGRGFTNVVEDGRVTGFRLWCATRTTAGPGRACSTASRSSSTASVFPRDVAAVDPAAAAPSPSTSCGARPTFAGSSTSSPRSRCRSPAGCRRGCTTSRSRSTCARRTSRRSCSRAVRRSPGVHGVIVPPAGGGRWLRVRRLDLQLHRRHLHDHDARGRRWPTSPTSAPPASRSSARETIPDYPEPDCGLDRRVAAAAGDVRPDRDELRLLGGHHDVARPRPDRRGGRGAAPARTCGWPPARLHARCGRSSASSRGSWTRTRSGRRRC